MLRLKVLLVMKVYLKKKTYERYSSQSFKVKNEKDNKKWENYFGKTLFECCWYV